MDTWVEPFLVADNSMRIRNGMYKSSERRLLQIALVGRVLKTIVYCWNHSANHESRAFVFYISCTYSTQFRKDETLVMELRFRVCGN